MRCAGRSAAILVLLSTALACLPPGSTAQQKEELPHPKSVEEVKKAMKDVLVQENVPGARAPTGGISTALRDAREREVRRGHTRKAPDRGRNGPIRGRRGNRREVN